MKSLVEVDAQSEQSQFLCKLLFKKTLEFCFRNPKTSTLPPYTGTPQPRKEQWLCRTDYHSRCISIFQKAPVLPVWGLDALRVR